MRRRVTTVVAGVVATGASVVVLGVASASPAFADTQGYELYCPGTPVGNIALNDVITTGTITPTAPSAGGTFNLTHYQSTVSLPTQIVTAAAALGNSAIVGSAAEQIDATGATPAKISGGTLTINTPIPSPVPTTGLTLTLPSAPSSIGPFTAGAAGAAISLTVDPAVSLTLTVSGSNLSLTCHPYPNNTVATGIVTTAPSGAEASPVIATATVGGSGPPATTAPTTAVTTAPTTAVTTATTTPVATSPLASTGPGPDLWVVALVGFVILYLGSVGLALVERPRSLLRRLLHLQRSEPVMTTPATVAAGSMSGATPTALPGHDAPAVRTTYRRVGDSPGLWFDGWEPDGRSRS
jgi:hypothetical protein